MKKIFRITEAARQIGCHPTTLKNLERQGLVKADRDRAGYRVYTPESISKISEILFPRSTDRGDREEARGAA